MFVCMHSCMSAPHVISHSLFFLVSIVQTINMCTYVCRFKSRNFSWKPYSVPGFPRPLFLVKFLIEKESNLTFLIEFFIPGFLRPLFLDQFLFETDSKLTIFD